jgi:hypothetical protein
MQRLHQQTPSRFDIKPETPLLRSTFGQRRRRASFAAYGMQQWGLQDYGRLTGYRTPGRQPTDSLIGVGGIDQLSVLGVNRADERAKAAASRSEMPGGQLVRYRNNLLTGARNG